MVDSVIFDLDGTLWDATGTVIDCWNEVLDRHDGIREHFTVKGLQSIMGLPTPQIAQRLLPYLPPERREAIIDECFKAENVFLARHGARLYPGMEEAAQALKKRVPLFIVSNCQEGYIESFFAGNGTGGYFTDWECYEATGRPKGENIRLVMERNGLTHSIYVGDTQGDRDAALMAGVPFVYARYGFGQVDGYDYAIDSLEELPRLIDRIS